MSEQVPGRVPAEHFRWQAVFQHSDEALFVLDRRCRLRFVNRAWEALTGVTRAEAQALRCRRPQPTAPGDSYVDVLAHALTPPPEVLQGHAGRARRLLPGLGATPRWWDVDFFPVRQGGKAGGVLILGRILPVPADASPPTPPLPERLVNLRQPLARRHAIDQLTSTAPALRRLADQVRLAAGLALPVALVGEPGVGKQTVARIMHQLGAARDRAFAALDCRRLPSAVGALLLGDRCGGQRAVLGTIYLAEPGQMPRDLQLRLAQVLAAPDAGASLPRIMAGFGVAPAAEARAGRLVVELACVLGTLVFEVPPLRERLDDLPSLVERMLERVNAAHAHGGEGGSPVTGLTPAAWEALRAHPWPGNLRELHAVLAAAADHVTGDRIDAADLPASMRLAQRLEQTPGRAAAALPLEELLRQAERRLIELALRRTKGHKGRAAQLLSIPRAKLWRRMQALGIADAEEGQSEEEMGDKA